MTRPDSVDAASALEDSCEYTSDCIPGQPRRMARDDMLMSADGTGKPSCRCRPERDVARASRPQPVECHAGVSITEH